MAKTITLSVDEKRQRRFRQYAEAKYGKKKGSLRKAYADAIDRVLYDAEQDHIRKEALAFLDRGIKVKKRWKFNRDELHER